MAALAAHSSRMAITGEEGTRKLRELVKDVGTCMLTTMGEDGRLYSRPMATQSVEFDGDLWFITSRTSPKIAELRHDAHVNLAYQGKHAFVSVNGTAQLVDDRNKLDELWSMAYRAWFPKGKDDPDIVLLKVNVETAEFWESHSPAVVHAIGLAKAVVTGKRYDGGENGLIDLH
jgi:general stress protein 26